MTPAYIRDSIDKQTSRQQINRALTRLQAAGKIRRVHRGLYEAIPSPASTRIIQLDLEELYKIEGGSRVEVRDSTGDKHLLELQDDTAFGGAQHVETENRPAVFQTGDES